jgi:hypothetical protein
MSNLQIGAKVKATNFENDIILRVISDDFINSPENKDKFTCSLSYAEQEMQSGRLQIVENAAV